MKKPKIPSDLVVTALLSAGLTIVFSLLYIALCIVALIYRFDCDVGENVHGANYIWNTLYNAYIQSGDCLHEEERISEDITNSYRVFIFVIITLCASTVTFIIAITLIAIIQSKAHDKVSIVVYCYVVVYALSLIIDIVFAVHFANDYAKFQSELEELPVDNMNYEKDIHRLGGFMFMTIALKGYIAHAINIVLVALLLVLAARFQNTLTETNHSIHKLGALNAYDSQRRRDETRQPQSDAYSIPFARSPNMYPIFIDDEPPRSPMRESSRSAFSNQAFDRSDSWHHSHPGQGGSRPFSYLEVKTTPKLEPAADPWRRDWSPGPPLPAPDYSPLQARRLKSALKPHDM